MLLVMAGLGCCMRAVGPDALKQAQQGGGGGEGQEGEVSRWLVGWSVELGVAYLSFIALTAALPSRRSLFLSPSLSSI